MVRKKITAKRVGFLVPVLHFYLKCFEIKKIKETAYPRELQLPIHEDCNGYSYLNEKFLLTLEPVNISLSKKTRPEFIKFKSSFSYNK